MKYYYRAVYTNNNEYIVYHHNGFNSKSLHELIGSFMLTGMIHYKRYTLKDITNFWGRMLSFEKSNVKFTKQNNEKETN